MASPDELNAYYDDYPQPPTPPEPAPPKPGEEPSQEFLDAQADPAFKQKCDQYAADTVEFKAEEAAYIEENGMPPVPDPVVPTPPPAAAGGGAGKPAARLGDMTAHGGNIVLGEFTVLIGNKPAARVSDNHVCPMVTGVVPHVGGPVLPAGSTTVLIGNLPAARMGDQATCTGPPDVVAQGEFTVFIG
jgi:uncharacterized Zn-binding protein involved in type VI secretion